MPGCGHACALRLRLISVSLAAGMQNLLKVGARLGQTAQCHELGWGGDAQSGFRLATLQNCQRRS